MRCAHGHAFDQARSGYTNLLPVQNKRSKNPGDDKAMLQSRRRFLEQGYYDCLVQALKSSIAQHVLSPGKILDLGCGEGFYTSALLEAQAVPKNSELAGIDISKAAVDMAAKRRLGAGFVVASNAKLPYQDGQFDLVICIFAPYDLAELSRVMSKRGFFILVEPGQNHLKALAQRVYADFRPHAGNRAPLQEHREFDLVDTALLAQNISVIQPFISDLLTMTPYYWSASDAAKQSLAALSKLEVGVEFRLSVYRNKGANPSST